jgi:hypothetical protein
VAVGISGAEVVGLMPEVNTVMFEEIGDAAAARRDMASLKIGDQRCCPAVGHRFERDTEFAPGHDAEEMGERA